MLTMTVVTDPEFDAVSRRLATAANGSALRRRMTGRMRRACDPLVIDIQRSILGIQSRGVKGRGTVRRARFQEARGVRGSAGLRHAVARGVRASVISTGSQPAIRVLVDNRHLPRSQRNLPEHLDNPKGWRHPVYKRVTRSGRVVNVWVRQYGQPYFRAPVRRHERRIYDAALSAVRDTAKELG